MKKYFITIVVFSLPYLALANGAGEVEKAGLNHQLQEFLPFEHLEEGHWFAVIFSVILWAALIFTIYTLVKKLKKS